MKTRVRLSALLQKVANWQEIVEVTGDTPMECIRSLETQFPEMKAWLYDKQGNIWPQIQCYLNNERIYMDELITPLKDGDELFIALAILGG